MATIITQPRTPEQSFVVKLATSIGRNHIQKQSGTYNAIYQVPESRTEEKTIELPAGGTYESNMSETYSNVVVSTSGQLSMNATFTSGVSTSLLVNKLFAYDSTILHFNLINNGTATASIKLNTVSSSMDQPLGLVYLGSAPVPLDYTEAFIKSLPSTGGSKDRTFTANPGALDKIFYCYPQAYGNSQFQVNGFIGGFMLVAQVPLSTTTGTVIYNVYESDNVGLGATNVTVLS